MIALSGSATSPHLLAGSERAKTSALPGKRLKLRCAEGTSRNRRFSMHSSDGRVGDPRPTVMGKLRACVSPPVGRDSAPPLSVESSGRASHRSLSDGFSHGGVIRLRRGYGQTRRPSPTTGGPLRCTVRPCHQAGPWVLTGRFERLLDLSPAALRWPPAL